MPQPPGGGTDIISRVVGQQLSEADQSANLFVIDNRTGAGTIVGTVAAANAQPDGYTLVTGLNANMAVNSALYATLAYDIDPRFHRGRDDGGVSLVLVVSKDFPAKSVKELIDIGEGEARRDQRRIGRQWRQRPSICRWSCSS